jgi:site-specific recombinase XerD
MPDLPELLDGFLRARRGEGCTRDGVRRYGDRLRLFAAWLAARGVADVAAIDALAVADYRDHCVEDRQNRPGTVINALTAIRAFAGWAVERGHMAADPTRAIRWPRRTRGAPKPLSAAELDQLAAILEAEPDDAVEAWHHRRNRLAVELMYYAGLRLGEVARLKVADVNLVDATVTIRDSKSTDRSVAVHADLLLALAEVVAGKKASEPVVPSENGRQMKPAVLAKIFERWLKQRGLAISAHRLRHTFGTELLRACGNLGIVQEALGHASPETTRIYTLIVVDDQRPAINRIPRLNRRRLAAD